MIYKPQDHLITAIVSPVAVTLMCKCGWHTAISRRQNALARASKERAAARRHLKDALLQEALASQPEDLL